MARIKRPGTKKTTKKKVTKKTTGKRAKKTPIERARAAVKAFEDKKKDLLAMQEEWEVEFPDAHDALQEVRQTEDDVNSLIKAAKPLVSEAGQSVGDFKFAQPKSSPHYDTTKLLSVLCEMSDAGAGEYLKFLNERGCLKELKVDQDTLKLLATQESDLRDELEDAFDAGGTLLTPRITVPKL